MVGGDGASEGDYILSINCTIVNATPVPVGCGSVVTGSIFGLPSVRGFASSERQHIFCSHETARVEANTCGSMLDESLELNDTRQVFDWYCPACSTDWEASCISFNVRCGGAWSDCYCIDVSSGSHHPDVSQ